MFGIKSVFELPLHSGLRNLKIFSIAILNGHHYIPTWWPQILKNSPYILPLWTCKICIHFKEISSHYSMFEKIRTIPLNLVSHIKRSSSGINQVIWVSCTHIWVRGENGTLQRHKNYNKISSLLYSIIFVIKDNIPFAFLITLHLIKTDFPWLCTRTPWSLWTYYIIFHCIKSTLFSVGRSTEIHLI